MPYWNLNYHLVWATKDREPLLTKETESTILTSFKLSTEEAGFLLRSTGFMPNHVHLIVSIPPTGAISDAVKRLKGASSREVRERYDPAFSWQPDYGVLSFGERSLVSVHYYVENQKAIHT